MDALLDQFTPPTIVHNEDFTLPSEDLFNKFNHGEADHPSTPIMLGPQLNHLETIVTFAPPEIKVHHDCMWTGLCSGREHHHDECTNKPSNALKTKTPAAGTPAGQQVQQQSLLKPRPQINDNSINCPLDAVVDPRSVLPMTPMTHRPMPPPLQPPPVSLAQQHLLSLQTPPMSDDEDHKPTRTFNELKDIFENLFEVDDADLRDYLKNDEDFESLLDEDLDDEDFEARVNTETLFKIKEELGYPEDDVKVEEEVEEEEEEEDEDEDDEEEEEEEEEDEEEEMEDSKEELIEVKRKIEQMRAFHADHSYHKGNGAMLLNLGIETPSDSEEEIDVVGGGNDNKFGKPMVLPTNPSMKDRHKFQRTMKSRFPHSHHHYKNLVYGGRGVKTILPLKRPNQIQQPHNSKRRAAVAQRPARQYKRSPPPPTSGSSPTSGGSRPYKRRVYSSDSEQEPSEKRSMHNNMERQRRIDLRNLFEDLKALVPDVNRKQRAAKVLILRGAAQYCRSLTQSSILLCRQVDDLRRKQEKLRSRLTTLRKDFAATGKR